MMGFIVSTSAVFLTAWIVYAATRRTAYLDGWLAGNKHMSDHLRGVPAGTRPECTTDPNCPLQQSWRSQLPPRRDSYEAKAAHVAMDDRIYGRNG